MSVPSHLPPAHRQARPATSRGFSLLEILIALIILVAGIATITWAFSSAIFASGEVESIDLALNIAQARMENLKDTDFVSLADSAAAADANFPDFFTAVDVTEGQNPMQIDVTVSWTTKGGSTSVTLTTLAADY